jgi:2-polyprenyl-3-methyl-5-hydroxy-6-metoxy-1,4-benzoquinol methylase
MSSSNTVEKVDYYANHELVVRWPFTIYHHPIEKSMADTLERVKGTRPRPLTVLVFGCGYFHEREMYPSDTRFILVDQDLRLKTTMDSIAAERPGSYAYTCQSAEEFARVVEKHAGTVDFITGKEVIEHITEMDKYFPLFKAALAPGGILWLSTPNYGDWTLPLVESTFLEAVARYRGFSRRDMHPNRYTKESLAAALHSYGFSSVDVQRTKYRFALTSSAVNAAT